MKNLLLIFNLFVLAMMLVSCAGTSAGLYPAVTPESDTVLNLHSNKQKTTFTIDGKKIATGKRVKVLVEDEKSYTITAKPENYREKEYFIQPPYSTYPVSFTFLIEDKLKDSESNIVKNKTISSKNLNIYTFNKNKKINNNSFALIIGISKYKENTPVEYADLSALSFKKLVNITFGVPSENIIELLNEDATSGQIKAKIELIKELSDKKGNLYVYFVGHGVPGKDGSTYMLPSDMSADSIHLEENLKLDNIYAKLSKAQAKNVFVFMDSCFSGKDDKGSLLYKGVAPVLKTNKTVISGKKLTIMTAGKSTDFANDYESKQQRLFSYFLIEELSQGNKNINDVYNNIQGKVKKASLIKGLGYKQVPQIYGNKKQTLY